MIHISFHVSLVTVWYIQTMKPTQNQGAEPRLTTSRGNCVRSTGRLISTATDTPEFSLSAANKIRTGVDHLRTDKKNKFAIFLCICFHPHMKVHLWQMVPRLLPFPVTFENGNLIRFCQSNILLQPILIDGVIIGHQNLWTTWLFPNASLARCQPQVLLYTYEIRDERP